MAKKIDPGTSFSGKWSLLDPVEARASPDLLMRPPEKGVSIPKGAVMISILGDPFFFSK